MTQKQITPQQRAALFAQMTRQNMQPISSQAGAENSRVTLNLPQTRLLHRTRLMVQATLNVKHASATNYVPAEFAPFTLIDNIRFEMNNGFAPVTLSGRQLYLHNMMRENADVLEVKPNGRGKNVQGLVASAAGTDNVIRFHLDIPNGLNDRDAIGLILLQNRETVANIHITFADRNALVKPGQTGYTLDIKNITVTPLVETFSIPQIPEALPDLSMLKLIQATSYDQAGAGDVVIKLPVSTTYRKLLFLVEDANGGVDESFIQSDIQLIFNQADTPYSVNPFHLASINHDQYGRPLPKGCWAFDFTFQGTINYSSGRDYIDTERLTEFWLKFKAAGACKISVVYEQLSRLR